MGKVACAYDNSLMESFFGSMQIELLDRRPGRPEPTSADRDLRMDRSFYNPARRHSALGYLSPLQFETLHTAQASAA